MKNPFKRGSEEYYRWETVNSFEKKKKIVQDELLRNLKLYLATAKIAEVRIDSDNDKKIDVYYYFDNSNTAYEFQVDIEEFNKWIEKKN